MSDRAPTFDNIFEVMSAASVGDAKARVRLPDEPQLEDLPTRFAIALNILLDDLESRFEEVRKLEQQPLRALIDGVQDYAIMMLDANGYVTSWNAGAERLLGYRAFEIVGKHIGIFYPPDESDKAARELEILARTGRFEEEDWRVRKDGTRFWGSVVVSAIRDAEGTMVGYAKVTRDLTERRRADEALRVANRELEAFSYSVAHDLRTPLRGMNGFAQMLLDTYADKIDEEGQKWLQSIVSNAERMGELIDGLLALARVSRSELRPSQTDLASLSREVFSRLRLTDVSRSVELVVPEHVYVIADPRLLRALLDNLISNAWKFTSKKTRALIIVGVKDEAFFVKDDGAGFDMAFGAKLFKPFQRLHGADEFPGTGIGLATAHRIVQRHGGTIWAEGTPGDGATFYFTLPPLSVS